MSRKTHTPRKPHSPVASPPTRSRYPLLLVGSAVAGLVLIGAFFMLRRPGSKEAPPPAPFELQPAPAPVGPLWFDDVTATSGIDFTYENGEGADLYTILESLGGGVGLLDYDRDGLLDVALTGGGGFTTGTETRITGRPTRLFRNLGKWKFEDVTQATGLAGPSFYSHGCAVADYDRDGWPDLLTTGFGRLALYRNVGAAEGGRRFEEVSAAAGLRDDAWCASAGWGDLEGDGDPDLYVCHYLKWTLETDQTCLQQGRRDVCAPQKFPPLKHALFENRGDGTFADITVASPLRDDGRGLGVIWTDVNDDAMPDLYVANDASLNHLYLNRHGKLEERGEDAGVAVDLHGLYNGSMGVDAADFDATGRPSLWVTNFHGENHALYQNLGGERFDHHSNAAGISALGRQFVGFGTGFFDADNDGWEDLVIVNGHVFRFPTGTVPQQRPVLLHNVERHGRRFFLDIQQQAGSFFQERRLGRGLAIGDLDNDGWPDLVICHTNSPVAILRNAAAGGSDHRWLGIELIGKDHRDLAGSSVTLQLGERRLTRYFKGGGSYLSSSDRRLLFGLADAKQVTKLTVRWSWGQTQEWSGLEPNAYYRLEEGVPSAQRL